MASRSSSFWSSCQSAGDKRPSRLCRWVEKLSMPVDTYYEIQPRGLPFLLHGKGSFLISYLQGKAPCATNDGREVIESMKNLTPGTTAPTSGQYEIIDVNGRRSGNERTVTAGEPLPPTPNPGES